MFFRACFWLFSISAFLSAATIEGIVHDPSGASVPGCAVSLTGSSPEPFRTDTSAEGHFHFDAPGGKYTLAVQCPGFELAERAIDLGDPAVTLNIEVKIAPQETTVEVGTKRSSLANADPNYLALRNAIPVRTFKLHNVELKRDVGTLTFNSGTISFLPPVLGKVAAAVFTGEGMFHLDPALYLETNYLQMISGRKTVHEPFRSVVLWFSDYTYEEITRQAEPIDAPPSLNAWQEFRNRARHRTENPRGFLESVLQDENISNIEAEILAELYTPNEPGSFRAFLHGNNHGDLRFFVNPRGAMPYLPSPEEVAFINFDPGGEQEGIWYLTHFAIEWKVGRASSNETRHTVRALHYRIDTSIAKNDHVAASCSVRFQDLTPDTRVVAFGLLPSLRVTRVTYKDREIPFIQEKRHEDGSFYVVMPEPMAKGQSYEIGIEYEGVKVVRKEEGAGNFAVGARTSWYPSLNSFTDRATYDLTFRVPKGFKLVAVGKLEKEWRDGGAEASHWVSDVPLAVAGFNYGSYKVKSVFDKTTDYQIEAYATVDPPDYLRQSRFAVAPSAMAESTLIDAQNAIRCFEAWFGKAPYGRIAVTQQPQFNFGQSWPTLVYLPVSAFLDSTQRYLLMGQSSFRFAGFIQEVTPHEVAHQWWGHMVGWASYRDQWLSEGFADYSAGLFLRQTESKPDKYLKYWERARRAILEKNAFGNSANDAGPLWMGIRLNTFTTRGAYNRLVYPKGGFVLRMLQSLMFNRQTGDRAFIDMMHDFVATNLHKNASTESFKAAVEKHMSPALDLAGNGKMDWFFREWVYGTEIPAYHMTYRIEDAPDGKFLLVGKVTQSGVSDRFVMSVPIYLEFDARPVRVGSVPLRGNQSSNEFKLLLPKKPRKALLNAEFDVLASESTAKEEQ